MANLKQDDCHFPRLFENELFLVTAATRSDLVAKLDGLVNHLSHPDPAALQDIAYTLGSEYRKGIPCLSVIAATHADLQQKLTQAGRQLQDRACLRIRDKSGIFYYEDKLGEGKLAFLFPGENAQYMNMLRDLCLHFPELRHIFDIANEACAGVDDGFLPGALNFPPNGDQASNQNQEEMTSWEKAIALVHTANAAMIKLLQQLELKPDAVVGHSFGELSAMEMAGILRPGNGKKRVTFLRDEYLHIKGLAQSEDLPQGIFMTVGGVERSKIENVISRFADTLCIAMENCPHQYVLCASGKKMESVIARAEELLANEGAICSRLPINRPYHTRFFEPAFPLQRKFLEQVGVYPPEIDIYSCTSTDRFPTDLKAIINLSAKYWMRPVKFAQTIEKMYADGIRIFVDAGPRGNLCAFASDILKGKPHLALPLNRAHRSDISQLNHVLGLLAAHGVHLNPAHLHTRWRSRLVELNGTLSRAKPTVSRLVPIPIFLPRMKADGIPAIAVSADESVATVEPAGRDPEPAATTLNPDETVMKAYLSTMDRFLASQGDIMRALLDDTSSGRREASPAAAAPPAGGAEPNRYPLLGQVTETVTEQYLAALRTYDIEEDLYLNDHSLGTTVSATDRHLRALPVMPLLISLEIAAEAGAFLFPQRKVVAITNIRANRWILLDAGKITLRTIARFSHEDAEGMHVAVALKEVDDADPRAAYRPSMVEATVVLADDYPSAPLPKAAELLEPIACKWAADNIYPQRTFHGPMFQGILEIQRISSAGLDGRIEVLPHSGLLCSDAHPQLCYDPLLVDAMGQAVWLWGSQELFSGRAYLPFSAEALRIFGPNLPPATRLDFNLRVRHRDDKTVTTDIAAVDKQGFVHAAIEGLCDRDFYITPALHRMMMEPVEQTFADPWQPPAEVLSGLNARISFSSILDFPFEIFDTGNGVWRKALAFLILNPPERRQWQTLESTLDRGGQWLLERAAAKDAVRLHLRKCTGQKLAAADICIDADEHSQPFVTGGWKTELSLIPRISLAGGPATAAAVCGDCHPGFALGLATGLLCKPLPAFIEQSLGVPNPVFLSRVEHPSEQLEWKLRLWCAYRAVAEALQAVGHTSPELTLVDIEPQTGRVVFQADDERQRQTLTDSRITRTAVTILRGNFVFGISTVEKKGRS